MLGRWSVDGTSGFALGINPSGRLEFWVGDGAATDAVAAEVKLLARHLVFRGRQLRSGERRGDAVPGAGDQPLQQPALEDRAVRLSLPRQPRRCACAPCVPADVGFLIGAATERNPARGAFFSQCYNGKIDRCGVQWRGAGPRRARRDPLRGRPPTPAPAGLLGHRGRLHGAAVSATRCWTPGRISCMPRACNRPVRGQTGWNLERPQRLLPLAPRGVRRHRVPRRRADRLPAGSRRSR